MSPVALASSAVSAVSAVPLPPHLTNSEHQTGEGATAKILPLTFVLNRHRIVLDPRTLPPDFDWDVTLLEFLRSRGIGLTGTKLGCAEGGCGACTVVQGKVIFPSAEPVNEEQRRLEYEYRAVNACLLPLVAAHDSHIVTVEGIGTPEAPHPIQSRLAFLFGSQCGFCTPGIVMSLYATIRTTHARALARGQQTVLTEAMIEKSLDGNLCRCTGYRPILDAAKTFATHPGGHDPSTLSNPFKDQAAGVHLTYQSPTSSGSSGGGSETVASDSNPATTPPSSETDMAESEKLLSSLASDATKSQNKEQGSDSACARGDKCCRVTKKLKQACSGSQAREDVESGKLQAYNFNEELIFPPYLLKRAATQLTNSNRETTPIKTGILSEDLVLVSHPPAAASAVTAGSSSSLAKGPSAGWGMELGVVGEDDLQQDLEFTGAGANAKDLPIQGSRPAPHIWLRPGSLESLLSTLRFYHELALSEGQSNPAQAAKMRAGNTETGIEVKFGGRTYSISIFVSSHLGGLLSSYSESNKELSVGGNISLSDFIARLQEANALQLASPPATKADEPYAVQLRSAFLTAMSHFASVQIRNVATPAGNLATASPISDLNPVWMAAGGSVSFIDPAAPETEGEQTCRVDEFFVGYRRTKLPPAGVITRLSVPIEGPPLSGGREEESGKTYKRFIRSYKQAKRRDDDIAIVTCCLYICLSQASGSSTWTIEDVRLGYGGLAPFTVLAKNTQAVLLPDAASPSVAFGDSAAFEAALAALSKQDFDLGFSVPGGMPAYRKSLALGFFTRFWTDISLALSVSLPSAGLKAMDQIVSAVLERGVTRGEQDLEEVRVVKQANPDPNAPPTMAERAVGKSVPHLSALKQTTGHAIYIDDIPPYAGELHGALVLSTRAHAKILSIDPSEALALPGVTHFVSAKDVRGTNVWNPPGMDEVLFAVDEVHMFGQVIGVVTATSKRLAQRAAKAIKVEYEDLEHWLTIEEAIERESFFPPRRTLAKGSWTEGKEDDDFGDCEMVEEGTSRMGGQEHFYLETQACLVVPGYEQGDCEIFSSTQNPTETQVFCAAALGIAQNQIVVRAKRLGGGFGGKETRAISLAAQICVAAHAVGRPVRCMLDRDEDMTVSGQRHPFLAHWKVGFTRSGKMLRLRCKIYNNGGWSQDLSEAVLARAMFHIENCLAFEHLHVEGKIARTHTMSNTAFRGFGGPQGMFVAEDFVDSIARRLQVSAEKIRRENMPEENYLTHYGQRLLDWNVPALWDQLWISAEMEARIRRVDEFNAEHVWKKRGIAMLPSKFGISFTALHLNQASALVHVYSHDGSVLLSHGGVEIGQGLNTKMVQVCADELGIPIELISIRETRTDAAANTSSTAASASSDLNGMAIKHACEQIMERLKPFLKDGTVPWKKAIHDAYFARISLSAVGHYRTPEIGFDWATRTGKPFFYYTQGVAATEVELDVLTGDHRIVRTDVHMEIGRSINPAVDVGQVEGAITQGFGLFTMEESLWTPRGQLITKGPGNYKIPSFLDTPEDMRISFMKEGSGRDGRKQNHLRTIQSSKGIGEPPLFLGASAFFALKNAIASVRADNGLPAEPFHLRSPATVERIRLACGDSLVTRATVGTEKKADGDRPFAIHI
ncbi:unnamed protein product [Tilletia controversa]|uniref:Xanthine dehydrogenase n=1 Tax=Tilletia controversa TaxID=13291 RepID=A0A8X7MXI4_9BASI|nr:hypothetical protein CF328_g1757 [Tilletia controversa]KAE8252804.1 hypothetical protein A4X06_0g1912 [Tilletia controversa]CAD6923331.1 unnamed protein product [Tilletia controversa]CAD6934509.1 unnamed protein product [Tilletia controversa]CAD6974623.1 unnamed protein product [Tilletia controversa]